MVQEAVDGYEEYLRQFVVAQGLAQADYPPMLAALDPAFADAALDNTRQAARDGHFYAGPTWGTSWMPQAAKGRSSSPAAPT